LAAGVNIAVHVIPPSELDTADSVPLGIVTSALVKPCTASEKVKITSDVSPAFSALSATLTVPVGDTPLTATFELAPSEPDVPGAGRVRSASAFVVASRIELPDRANAA